MLADELLIGESRPITATLVTADRPSWHQAVADGELVEVAVEVHEGRAYLHASSGPPVEVIAPVDELALFDVCGVTPVVVICDSRSKTREVVLQARLFEDGMLPGPLFVAVDDAVAQQARIAGRVRTSNFDGVSAWLREEFLMVPRVAGESPRIVHTGSSLDNESGAVAPFRLYGRRWVADVAMRDDSLRITRMTDAANRSAARLPRLTSTDVHFVDQTAQAIASEALRAALAGLNADRTSYLELWDGYNTIEREALVEDAQLVGMVHYRSCALADHQWRFDLDDGKAGDDFLRNLETRPGTTELEASDRLPPEFNGGRGHRPTGVHGRLDWISRSGRTLALEVDGDREPPPSGYLYLALSGDRVRLDRRDDARDRIASDQAEMPGLRLLLEGHVLNGLRTTGRRRSRQRALDRTTRDVFGTNEPTETQLEALRMAIDTPDVLLVQGPPGTGKTQFITALLANLDQLADGDAATNRTLISSFQHTAVDNVSGRARHRGLPPTRVSNDRNVNLANVREWRDETVARIGAYITEHRPEVAERQLVADVELLTSAYHAQPLNDADLTDHVNRLYELTRQILPPHLLGRLSRVRSDLRARAERPSGTTHGQLPGVTTAVRALRVTEVSFSDDGPQRAAELSAVLGDSALVDAVDRALLRTAASGNDEPAGFLTDLHALRNKLLNDLLPDSGIGLTSTHDPEVEELFLEITQAVEEAFQPSGDGVDDVLRRYREDLSQDLSLVVRTLTDYNAVLASTVQQVRSDEMSRVLAMPLPRFDTVIVDEAARANPLDLMIPLSCAVRRIILVGDHKQLPHSLEQKVERELRRNRSLDGSELTKSLFERWFDLFSGERPSVRTIRLDTQFRMHPVLGRFVSQAFYGGPEVISSHPSTRTLTHQLGPYAGKVAAWIDVPLESGPDKRIGTSRVREAEATRLAVELRHLADLDYERALTFGVITFYREQQREIERRLVDEGLGVMGDDGEFTPVPAVAMTAGVRPRPRLSVGTVDAFQGMEFDVVLLSVTRSSAPAHDSTDLREAISRYGHLLSDSRMCVAMSRQRRLLVAVGDAEMARRPGMPEVPGRPGRSVAEGIAGFLELCEGEDGAGVRP